MYPNLSELSERLTWARRKNDLSQTALAKKLNVSQGAIEKAENGKVRQPKFLPEAAEILNVPYQWLANNQQNFDQAPPTPAGKAPIYGYASGAGSKNVLNDGAIVDYAPRHNPLMGNKGFYMIVVGDSMEPRYEQGEKIAVSRTLPPRKGRDCVIELIDGTAALKRFVSMSEREIVCEQLNPKKTVTYNPKEVIAVYAVVGHEF